MRHAVLGASIVLAAMIAAASAQTNQSKQVGPGSIVAPKGSAAAPSKAAPKSSGTMAPRGPTMAPLTSAECTGLGGTVKTNFTCKGGSGCYTVDQHGVIRMACINK